MRILLVRHAVAEDRETFARTGMDDALRPLTVQGRKRMRRCCRGLVHLVPRVDAVVSSPLVRAVETAALLAAAYDIRSPLELDALAPGGDSKAVLAWLAHRDPTETLVLVGHAPDLGQLASWLLSGMRSDFIELKKASACLLAFDNAVEAGAARFLWSVPSKVLRRLGR